MAFANKSGAPVILLLAVPSMALYGLLAAAGDLRARLPLLLISHGVLTGLMLLAWWRVSRGRGSYGWVLGSALVFRIVAAYGEPAASDDVFRYLWDGRVQLHGIHPYRYAPAEPELAPLRDEHWTRINHPEIKTIYPPGAQMLFAILAAVGAGPLGFKLAMGLADFGVVLVLALLLRQLGLPRHRVVLYAWNPLAVLETAGSGHVEPVGVLFVLLAAAWIIERREKLSTIALAAAIQVKILPVVLLPGYIRRYRVGSVAVLLAALAAPVLAYALGGPIIGAGLFDYAERWEYNAFLYSGVEKLMEGLDTGNRLRPVVGALRERLGDGAVSWTLVYAHIWPRDMARLTVALAALAWSVALAWRAERDLLRENLLVLGGVLLLSPTVHPWYVLWVLPLAAAYLSWGWLVFALLVPLAYSGADSDVSWLVRCIEYVPALSVMFWTWLGGGEWARERFLPYR